MENQAGGFRENEWPPSRGGFSDCLLRMGLLLVVIAMVAFLKPPLALPLVTLPLVMGRFMLLVFPRAFVGSRSYGAASQRLRSHPHLSSLLQERDCR